MAKAYTLDQIQKNIKDQSYKYVCLVTDNGKVIVPYNKASDTKGALGKFAEIRKRFNVLEDGVYYVECKNSFNLKITPDSYPVLKGNATLEESRPAAPAREAAPLSDGKVMSYQEALKLTQENARLTSELTAAKKELSELEKDYDELEADYNELEKKPTMGEQAPGAVQNWVQTTIPQLIPITDRFFELQERKLALEEKKIQMGIIEPKKGLKPSNGNGNGRSIPQPGTQEFEQYMDQLEKLSDEHFVKECEYLAKHHPKVYETVYAEFNDPDEQEEEDPQ